jgi:hypothetical protein
MTHDSKFGPCAQTPEQRAWVVKQMQAVIPALKKKSAYAQKFYEKYISGELSWLQVRQAIDLAADRTSHS